MIKIGVPAVMGIVNLTDDSFYEKSRFIVVSEAIEKIAQMLSMGAEVIDIGACSSRPGSHIISEDEEWRRLEPVLITLKTNLPHIKLSIDTFRSYIVHKAAETFGEFIINDISAGEADEDMLRTAATLDFTYIAMHKRGMPHEMQNKCDYINVVEDVHDYFLEFFSRANRVGLKNVIIDPGFGFSKTLDQNYLLLNELKRLNFYKDFQKIPLLVGISRKSMIYRLLDLTPEESLSATTALNLVALQNGADILRVHDVKEGIESVKLFLKINS